MCTCLSVLQDTFNVKPYLEDFILKSAGTKWRQFKTRLTNKFVLPYLGEKKKLSRPPKQYEFVCKSAWKKFVAQRTAENWKVNVIFFFYLYCL